MRSRKNSVFVLAVSVGLVAIFFSFGPMGITGIAQAAPEIILVTFTDTSPTQYMDLNGNVLGEGVYVGELRCVGNVCNQKIEFLPILGSTTDSLVYEYKFKSRGAFHAETETVVVTGTGTIVSGSPKIRFSFTGVFENNGDGTVRVVYTASTPEASFVFPAVPGTFSILADN